MLLIVQYVCLWHGLHSSLHVSCFQSVLMCINRLQAEHKAAMVPAIACAAPSALFDLGTSKPVQYEFLMQEARALCAIDFTFMSCIYLIFVCSGVPK